MYEARMKSEDCSILVVFSKPMNHDLFSMDMLTFAILKFL